jgi:CheY-like chemotaxis protein
MIAFAAHSAMSEVDGAAHGPQLLIVDDDPAICLAYDEILRAQGFDVATARNRVDALAQIDRLHGMVDVLIMDIALPDIEGADLAREIAALIGHRPALYISGWPDEFWDLSTAQGPWLVLRKPVPIPQLIAAIRRLMGRGN